MPPTTKTNILIVEVRGFVDRGEGVMEDGEATSGLEILKSFLHPHLGLGA